MAPQKMQNAIVVVTPVKNEVWILEKFLSVTSLIADYIIVADQGSTDGSREICERFEKVTLINNDSPDYSEASRQKLLLNAARNLVPEPKVILGLDADEILSANVLSSPAWEQLRSVEPRTNIYFEWVNLYGGTQNCVREFSMRPFGYADDGAPHEPNIIHSPRVPVPKDAARLELPSIKLLHYAYTRLQEQTAKHRLYSVIESTLGTSHLFARRQRYLPAEAYGKANDIEPTNPVWFEAWEEAGIDVHTVLTQEYSSYDTEVLKYFNKYGYKKFYFENIWDMDWERYRIALQAKGVEAIPEQSIKTPWPLLQPSLRWLTALYGLLVPLVRLLKKT